MKKLTELFGVGSVLIYEKISLFLHYKYRRFFS